MAGNIIKTIVQAINDNMSSSDDEDEFRLIFNYNDGERISRNKGFVDTVVPKLSDIGFKQNFRLSRSTFEEVLTRIAPVIGNLLITGAGRPPTPPQHQLLMALWYYATPDCYRSVCNNFDVGQATAVRTVRRVTKAIYDLGPTEIKWPSGSICMEVVEGFRQKSGFPGTIGAIDGTHIAIPAPRDNGVSYVNRKGFHSIILQAVCNHEARFTHCYAGQVGSVHDARVLRLSPIQSFIDEDPTKFPNNTHLIGDPAYPLSNRMMVPFKDNGHLTNRQKNFNFCLSSTRCIIERAFGLLKGRFRCLKFLDMYQLEEVPKVIVTCCILHNICQRLNDLVEEGEEYIEENGDVDQCRPTQNDAVTAGNVKRLDIVSQLPIRYPNC